MRRLSIATLLLFTGCQLITNLANQAFEKPRLTFQRVEVTDATLAGATLNLRYTLANPNAVGLELANVSYALAVEGHPVVSGSPPNGLLVPAGGSTELTFPAQVRFADLVPTVEALLTKDSIHYRADGTVGVNTPLGVLTLPLTTEGDFEVPKLPGFEVGTPRVRSMSWSEASLDVPITLTSRNSYPIPLGSLRGALLIGGVRVAEVQGPSVGTLQPHAKQTFSLPISIHVAEATSAAATLAQGSGTVAFQGTLSSGPLSVPVNFSQNVRFVR